MRTISGRIWNKEPDGSWTSGPWSVRRAQAIATKGSNGWLVHGPWEGWAAGSGIRVARSLKEASWEIDEWEKENQ